MNKKTFIKSILQPLLIISSALTFAVLSVSAGLMPSAPSPYTFGPEGRTIEDLQEFSKPSQMMNILPNRPVQATDKYGNKEFFTASGQLVASVAKDGSVKLSLTGITVSKDVDGQVLSKTEVARGTNKVEIKNDQGQVVGYQELGLGGRVVKEYDYQNNVTKTYKYNDYGKNAQFILDELSQTKTICDREGKPSCDVNYEGAKVAWYRYDDKGRLEQKTDIQQNKTYYDKSGNMTYTEDQYKNVVMKYSYKKDDEAHWILDKAVDYRGNTTEYKNGKPKFEKSQDGKISKEYVYNGLTLLYTFDQGNNETTWYDIDGKPLVSTFNEYLKKEWLYAKGKLVGLYDASSCMVTYYINDQEVQKDRVNGRPTAEEVKAKIDSGEIRKQYIR